MGSGKGAKGRQYQSVPGLVEARDTQAGTAVFPDADGGMNMAADIEMLCGIFGLVAQEKGFPYQAVDDLYAQVDEAPVRDQVVVTDHQHPVAFDGNPPFLYEGAEQPPFGVKVGMEEVAQEVYTDRSILFDQTIHFLEVAI